MKKKEIFLVALLGHIGCLSPSINFDRTRVKRCGYVPEVLKKFVKGDMEARQFFAWRKDELGQYGDKTDKTLDDLEIESAGIRSKINKWKFSRTDKCFLDYANKDVLLITISPKDPYAFFSKLFEEIYLIDRETGKVISFFKIIGQGFNKIMVENNVLYIAIELKNQPVEYYCIELNK